MCGFYWATLYNYYANTMTNDTKAAITSKIKHAIKHTMKLKTTIAALISILF